MSWCGDRGVRDDDDSQPDFVQDPDATLDYPFEWAPFLEGDTIKTSVFLLPDGLTQVSADVDGSITTVFLSGAQCGRLYRCTNRVTTGDGRSEDWTIRILGRPQ